MEMKDFVCYEDENGVNETILHYYEGNSKKVIIPAQFETIEFACFQGNSTIEEVEIPETVTFIKSMAFDDCPNLKSVKIPGNLRGIAADTFGNTEATVRFLKTNPNYVEKDGFMINKTTNTLLFVLDSSKETYSIPVDMKFISYSCFMNCENLKEIAIPENILSIEMMAFFRCANLKKVQLPESLKYIGPAAFALCDNLTDCVVPEKTEVVKLGNEIIINK